MFGDFLSDMDFFCDEIFTPSPKIKGAYGTVTLRQDRAIKTIPAKQSGFW